VTAVAAATRLPSVEALERLWQRVSARPLWAPPNFFRYVELRARARLAPLDSRSLCVIAPAGMVNDCASCRDNCCIGPRSAVLLRLRDIATLIDLGREQLITRSKPVFAAAELSSRPALSRQVRSESWYVFPMLAQNRFHACAALTDRGRCSLHPHWPLACSRFPYALDITHRELFYSRRCDAFWIRHDGRADDRIEAMKVAAVASYNERLKDLVLLAYAERELEELGLTRFLATEAAGADSP
jgi:Fe-S-cluster containining protein